MKRNAVATHKEQQAMELTSREPDRFCLGRSDDEIELGRLLDRDRRA
jgi:hypothetical protein